MAVLLALLVGAGCTRSSRSSGEAVAPASADVAPAPASSSAASASSSATKPLAVLPEDPPMVLLPKGTYQQGSAGATGDDMGWPHVETVPAFWLDVTEVTVRAYRRCIAAGACSAPPRSARCNLERPNYDDDPVNCVTWAEATAFCRWRRAELPTEGMWEYAAGGRHGWEWPHDVALELHRDADKDHFDAFDGVCKDHTPSDLAHLPGREGYGRGGDTTCPVGSLPRGDSPEGVKDLEGNVSEWTSSIYCRLPGKRCDEGKRTVKGQGYDGIITDYTGRRHRLAWPAERWDPQIGFRCARVARGAPAGGR